MLLHIFNFGIFSDEETVDSVMLTVGISTVVNSASSYNHHITVISNEKIIVNHLCQSALTQHNRDMNTLILCAVRNADINSFSVLFAGNLNMLRAVSLYTLAVGTDIISSFRHYMKSGNFF